MLEDKIQKTRWLFFRFSIGNYVVDQRSGDGRFVERIGILAINCRSRISKCWIRRLPLRWTRSSNTPTLRIRSVSRNRKAQKEDRFLWGRQITFTIYDDFRVTGAHDTVLNYADYSLSLFVTTMFRNAMWDGTIFVYNQRFHRMIFWKVSTN